MQPSTASVASCFACPVCFACCDHDSWVQQPSACPAPPLCSRRPAAPQAARQHSQTCNSQYAEARSHQPLVLDDAAAGSTEAGQRLRALRARVADAETHAEAAEDQLAVAQAELARLQARQKETHAVPQVAFPWAPGCRCSPAVLACSWRGRDMSRCCSCEGGRLRLLHALLVCVPRAA